MAYYRMIGAHADIAQDTLVFDWATNGLPPPQGCISVTTSPNGMGRKVSIPLNILTLPNPQPNWREFEQLAEYFMSGKAVPPGIVLSTPETLDTMLNNIVGSYAPMHFQGRLRFSTSQAQSNEIAIAVMGRTQGGDPDGTVRAMLYSPTWRRENRAPRAANFQLCEHERKMGHGANPTRGWHPGRCTKCGLDMTVDSGD